MKKGKILGIIGIVLALIIIFVLTYNHGSIFGGMTGGTTKETSSIGEMKTVTKVIDGDTLIAGGESVRLLGMDADEKGYPCYYAAKQGLEELVLGKEVYLEQGKDNKDIYGRYLRYVLFNGENIDLRLVQEGLVVARTNEGEKYQQDFIDAENYARENRVGCKWENSTWLPGSNIQNEGAWSRLIGSDADIVQACDAGNFVGQEKIIQGKVVDVHQTTTGTTFMDFEKPYPNNCFSAVIFKSDLGKFNDPEQYANKLVRVRGKIKLYQGKTEMVLENEDMIEASS
jgi:endonuclease YncB( thermonuclease family)